jgi:hypothetical protein
VALGTAELGGTLETGSWDDGMPGVITTTRWKGVTTVAPPAGVYRQVASNVTVFVVPRGVIDCENTTDCPGFNAPTVQTRPLETDMQPAEKPLKSMLLLPWLAPPAVKPTANETVPPWVVAEPWLVTVTVIATGSPLLPAAGAETFTVGTDAAR